MATHGKYLKVVHLVTDCEKYLEIVPILNIWPLN